MSPTKSPKMKPSQSSNPMTRKVSGRKKVGPRKLPILLAKSGLCHNGVRWAEFTNGYDETEIDNCPSPASESNAPSGSHVNDANIPAQDSASYVMPVPPSNDILHSQIPVPISGYTNNATQDTYYGTGPPYPPTASFPQHCPFFRREDFNSGQGASDNIFSMANNPWQSSGYVTNNDFPSVNPHRPTFYDPARSIPQSYAPMTFPPNIDVDYFTMMSHDGTFGFPNDEVTYSPYQNLG
ncbi:hypothetical protein BYT27DRAFT_7242974 [Phlegmacium glaucopus]|nr:hypothetical protein BYT27DRAFT_7242974 [Phlegmacium glaucopus]